MQIIHTRFLIIHISPIPERLHSPQRLRRRPALSNRRTPSIIRIANNNISSRIKNRNHIALQVLDVSIRNTVVSHDRWTILCIIEEMQFIAFPRHMHNILPMQGIVRYHPIYCFFHPQSVFIIHKLGVGVNALHPRTPLSSMMESRIYPPSFL